MYTCKIHLCKISAGFWNAIILRCFNEKLPFQGENARATSNENAHIQKNVSGSSGNTMYGGLKLWPTPISGENPSIAP
jgi:mevalonate pyrophosphate decarboxylase